MQRPGRVHQEDRPAEGEHEAIPAAHHYAAPEVEEWKPHPYAEVGVGRKESLKGDLPAEQHPEHAEATRHADNQK